MKFRAQLALSLVFFNFSGQNFVKEADGSEIHENFSTMLHQPKHSDRKS